LIIKTHTAYLAGVGRLIIIVARFTGGARVEVETNLAVGLAHNACLGGYVVISEIGAS
jgi:hypothetical protein